MKKNFKYFITTWLITFVVFNALVFLLPAFIKGYNRFALPVFWVAYALVLVAFTGNLIASVIFCKHNTDDQMFLNIPIIKIAYTSSIVCCIIGAVFMIFPFLPAWLGGIISIIVTTFYVLAGFNAHTTGKIINSVNENVVFKTQFMRSALDRVNTIMQRADENEKQLINKVHDALQYSDSVSSESTYDVETDINIHIETMADAVSAEDYETVEFEVESILGLIQTRNSKCKAFK